MTTDISFVRRCRDQEIAIARLMEESELLREQNADLLAQLEAARRPLVVAGGISRLETTVPIGAAATATAQRQSLVATSAIDRLEATLPVCSTAPVSGRATLTRWLSGHVPIEVLDDARLLVSELITDSVLRPDVSDDDLLRLAVELGESALRVEVRAPGTTGVVASRELAEESGRGLVLRLVDEIATRWGVNRTGGTQVWFEVDTAVAD